MVPAVPQCMVLNHELRGHRSAEAQREGRCLVQLVIRESARTAAAASRLFLRSSSSAAALVASRLRPGHAWH